MRSGALAAAFAISLAWSGAALAQDVTYPFETDQTAPARKAAKPKPQPVKPALAALPAPAATPALAVPLPKSALRETTAKADPAPAPEIKAAPKPEIKSEPKVEPKADPLPGIAAGERATIGWTVVLDPVTGVQLGLPAKWVPQIKQAEHGTHWSSRHGDIQVETFRIQTTETINALFERMKREPSTRRVETSAMKPDNFVVTGLQGLKKFGVRAQFKNGELRGYTVLYDQMMEGIVAPVTQAMALAFSPFPDTVGSIAALSKPVDYGSGLIVSAEGHILTDRRLADSCTMISVAGLGNAERVALDRDHGLALLRVYGKRDLKAASFSREAPAPGELTLLGVPDPQMQQGGRKLAEVKARLTEGNALRMKDSAPVAGFSGAAALDGKGLVLGIMETRNAQFASAEPSLPPVRLVPAAAIRQFLNANNVDAPADGDARAAVVRVICVHSR